jgi:hypothetical protein
MNPLLPHLDPMPLPAPPALFWFLSILTFTLHLVPMSAVLGGSVLGVVSRWKAPGHPHHARLASIIGRLMPVLIAASVTLGVAALLFLQVLYGRLFFASAIVMGWIWLAVVPIVIGAYYAAYAVAFSARANARLGLAVSVAVLAAVVGFIYTNNMTLMLRPEAMHAFHEASARGLQLNTGDAVVAPRYLHMVVGAVAIAGLLVAVIGAVRRRAEPGFCDWALVYGSRWFVAATVVNLGIGTWHLAALPREVFLLFMGRDLVASLLLAGGVVTALAAMGAAMLVSNSPRPGRMLSFAAGNLVLTLALMVLVRDVVRRALFEAMELQPASWVVPQWGPIVIFLGLLVAAIALVAWMVAVLLRAPAAAPARGAEVV